jgi:hypothetical protein
MALTDPTYRVLRLINHDDQFTFNQNQAGSEPIILNTFDLSDPSFIDELSDHIFTDGAGADFIARCQCGETEGNNKVGMKCQICGTEVSRSNLLDDDNLVCKNWVACPSELPGGWLAPKIYLNLATWLSYDKGKRNYLDDILDVDTPIPFELQEVVQGKGFNYLYNNFDRIIDFFVHNHPVIAKKPDTTAMRWCLQLNRDRIFCHYVPILNAAINPIISAEGNSPNKRRYSDITADHILKAAVSLSGLEFSAKSRRKNRPLHVERTAFKAFKDIIAYVEEATSKYISTKKAIPRTHIFGSRFHWSFRAVIVPIIGPHKYYELHVPWQMAVNTLRVHISGVLFREYNLTIEQVVSKVRKALQVIDPDIKQIMDKMIEDSPFPGLPCVWDRPPSIRDGSVMLKYWTKIKTDLEDACVGITPTDVALPNADFDGDNLAGVLIMETDMVKAMRHLSPSALIYNRNTGEVSSEIGISKTLAVTWNSFLEVV